MHYFALLHVRLALRKYLPWTWSASKDYFSWKLVLSIGFWMQPVNFIGLRGSWYKRTKGQSVPAAIFCSEEENRIRMTERNIAISKSYVTDLMTVAIQSFRRIFPCRLYVSLFTRTFRGDRDLLYEQAFISRLYLKKITSSIISLRALILRDNSVTNNWYPRMLYVRKTEGGKEGEEGEGERILDFDRSRKKSSVWCGPLQSSIYISGFLLTSDRTDTRTLSRHS